MIHIVWAYTVRQDQVSAFISYYGNTGTWARFFRQSPEYRGTTLLHDVDNSSRYVTIDNWTDRGSYERFLRDHAVEYEQLDRVCAAFTVSETSMGILEREGPTAV